MVTRRTVTPGLRRRVDVRRRPRRPPDGRARRSAAVLLEPEADLQPDLEVLDVAVHDVAADLGDLEPVEVAQGAARARDRVADRRVDAVRRRSDDLADGVHVVGHRRVLTEGRGAGALT